MPHCYPRQKLLLGLENEFLYILTTEKTLVSLGGVYEMSLKLGDFCLDLQEEEFHRHHHDGREDATLVSNLFPFLRVGLLHGSCGYVIFQLVRPRGWLIETSLFFN